jgi:uncharacterized protein YjiS (DUF1127 family)
MARVNALRPPYRAHRSAAAAFLRTMASELAPAVETLRLRLARQRTRRLLARLDDRQLRDIGISRIDAMREAVKPFWAD